MKRFLTSMSFLFIYMKKYLFFMISDILSGILSRGTDMLNAVLLGELLTAALTGDISHIWFLLLLVCGASLFNAACNFISFRTRPYYAAKITRDLRDDLLDKLQRVPLSYFEQKGISDVVSALSRHTWSVQSYMETGLSTIIRNLIALVAAGTYLCIMNFRLFLISIVMLVLCFKISEYLSGPAEKYNDMYYKHWKETTKQIQDTVAGAPLIKAFNLKDQLILNFKQQLDSMLQQNLNITRRASLISPIRNMVSVITPVTCLIFGGYFVIQGQISAVNLVVAMQLVRIISTSIGSIPHMLHSSSMLATSIKQMQEIFDLPEEQTGSMTDMPKENNGIAVSFKDVSFSYDADTPVLSNVTFDVNIGTSVALVGESGSGKSTITKLIIRAYEKLDSGHIEIMGRDIAEWDIKALRSIFSLVPQDIYLFPGTVIENIRHGRLDATDEEVLAASRAAKAHEFILGLPDGYETKVGERGIRLSGGQKQRIAIARAFLKNAPILILDEPTSALDTATEWQIQSAYERLMAGRTVIVIAHRLSTIKNAENILVLDHGRIVQSGRHEELLAQGGVYTNIYARQFHEGEVINV